MKVKEQSRKDDQRQTSSAPSPQSVPARQILHLQRVAGNQATLRYLQRKCACGGSCPSCQNKSELPIGPADDQHEREADQTAARIMRMPNSSGQVVQRKCAQCEEEEQRTSRVQRSESGTGPATAPPIVHDVLNSPGQPLDSATRTFMEPRFRQDFSRVRVHDNSAANESARAIHARAYTVGEHVVLGRNGPGADHAGLRLMAHELTHVVQQTGHHSSLKVQRDPDDLPEVPDVQLHVPPIGESLGFHRRRPLRLGPDLSASLLPGPAGELDLNLLDQELTAGGPLTKIQGAIGHGSRFCGGRMGSRSCPNDPAEEDPFMPIEALVYPHTPSASSSPVPSGGAQPQPAPAPRALVIGGIHGNEGGAPQHVLIAEQLRTELDSGLRRDFDTILIPVMNPGGLQDNDRLNRHGVDLNRNFPGLPGFPAGTPVVEQPEVTAVKRAIQVLRPSRILVLHAHEHASKGGVYADPVEGEARELACRMALRMQGTPPGRAVVPGNRLTQGVCESRYPDSASVTESTTQSSIGAWGSAATAVGGGGATVITHEIPDKDNIGNPLPLTGAGRSVASMMPGIRDFLLDNRHSPSEADDLLRRSVTATFLSGQNTAADARLRDTIEQIVHRRFDDMDAFYRVVWLPSQPSSVRSSLPGRLTIVTGSGVRDFDRQAGIVRGELRGTLGRSSTDAQIEHEILRVMETRSMPGFSRHHWGTDLDVVSAERVDWDPATGRFRALIPFFQEHAFRFGFFHPYTAGYSRSGSQPAQAGFPTPSARHYLEESWHLSYWPFANVLQQLWIQTFSSSVLANLIAQTAHAIHGAVPEATMVRVLTNIGLTNFQSNVAPSPQ